MFLLEAAMCHKFVASLNHHCHDFLLTVFSGVVAPFQKSSYLLPNNAIHTVSHQLAAFQYHFSKTKFIIKWFPKF
jgi:hypothetical protein